MNKRERLALIVVTLALQGRTTAEDLAETLDAPDTTVYSDIRTLRKAGIPVSGEPGPGGGFSLRPEHTEADVQVVPRDAILLLMATGMLLSRTPTPAGATVMRTSMEAVLSSLPRLMSELWTVIWSKRFAPPDTPDVSLYSDLPELLTQAILAKLPLSIDVACSKGDVETVTAKPEAIQWSSQGWKLLARDADSGKKIELGLPAIRAARLAKNR